MTRDAFFVQLDKILLTGLIGGGAALGMRIGTDKITDELVKIRETLAVAVSRLENHEQRLTNIERLYFSPRESAP